jgi:hypothetical protein
VPGGDPVRAVVWAGSRPPRLRHAGRLARAPRRDRGRRGRRAQHPRAARRVLSRHRTAVATMRRGIEVIRRTRGDLGPREHGERPGWVSLRYLARRPGQWDGAFPESRACYGTEPFWSLRATATSDLFDPDIEAQELRSFRTLGLGEPARQLSHDRRRSGRPVVAFPRDRKRAATACRTGLRHLRSAPARHRCGGSAPVTGCCTLLLSRRRAASG